MVRSRLDPIEEEVRGLRSLLSVAQVVVSSLELSEVLQNILVSAMGIIETPAGSIALYDESTGLLTLQAHAGLSPDFIAKKHWRVKPGGLTHRILEESEPFVIGDTAGAHSSCQPLVLAEGIRSLVAMPLKIKDKRVGILYLDDFVPRSFARERLQLLAILASFASMSIDNARLHECTRQLACTDGLTGLYNHRQFKTALPEHIARTLRSDSALALIMFDVDNFKEFNDRYGHPVGDKVLVTIADILQELSRKGDTAFRYGGEEFVIVLPATEPAEALAVAERLRRSIAEDSGRRLGGAAEGVTVSVGVAVCPRDGRDPETLLQAVDRRVYQAKGRGKNNVCHLTS